jgi:excisionase family DNA binding protein
MTLVAPQPTLLTVEQVADRLGTTVRFVRRLRAERRLTFFKIGKHLRVSSADLETYIATCREEPYPVRSLQLSTDQASTGTPRAARLTVGPDAAA